MPILATLKVPANRKLLEAACEGLVAVNEVLLQRRPLPSIYAPNMGITYRPDRSRPEKWLNAHEVFAKGGWDCQSLAAWRAAELRNAGDMDARVRVIRTGPRRFHAIVQRGDGRVEDPSRILKR